MTWRWRLSERQRAILAYLSEHPQATIRQVQDAYGFNKTNTSNYLNVLYVHGFVRRYQERLTGIWSWHLNEKGWKALQAPSEAPTPPTPRLLRPRQMPLVVPDRDIDAYWDAHPHLTWEQAKRVVQKLAGVAS